MIKTFFLIIFSLFFSPVFSQEKQPVVSEKKNFKSGIGVVDMKKILAQSTAYQALVDEFEEKPQMQSGFINGGFFVFNEVIFNYLNDKDDCDLEYGTLDVVAHEKKLYAYKHNGFWQCMDNIREKEYLDEMIKSKNTPWLNKNV